MGPDIHLYLVIDFASTWVHNFNIIALQVEVEVEVEVEEARYSPVSAVFGHGSRWQLQPSRSPPYR
jgi:hypothetical protein